MFFSKEPQKYIKQINLYWAVTTNCVQLGFQKQIKFVLENALA
jgi:hypothetical protein